MVIKKYLLAIVMIFFAVSAKAAVTINEAAGWFESAYVTWQKTAGMSYHVYVSPAATDTWTKLDDELVREYPTYGRADALGLKAGSYQLKVVPVSNGAEVGADAAVTDALTVMAHDRSGFAHVGVSDGIGAYKNDGTLKDNAKVLYVWANNAKTITFDVAKDNKGGVTTGTGLQDIITLYQKGYETTPLAIRIIGTIKAGDMDRFDSSAEGLQVKGKNEYSQVPTLMPPSQVLASSAAIVLMWSSATLPLCFARTIVCRWIPTMPISGYITWISSMATLVAMPIRLKEMVR